MTVNGEGEHTARRTVVDLYSGAGGLALGLEMAGLEVVALVEEDPDSKATILANRAWNVMSQVDELLDSPAPELGLLSGNLPSTGISVAGQVQPELLEDQYAEVIKLVARLEPRAVLFANVAGLMQERFQAQRNLIVSSLARLGYQTSWRVLDASHFGLAQKRQRALLVGIRTSTFAEFDWPIGQALAPTVGEALFPLMSERGWPGAAQWARGASDLAPTIVGGSKVHGGADLGPSRTKTIWWSIGVDGTGIADLPPGDDESPRYIPRLTIPMVATLQGFPPNWKWAGRKTSSYRQVASAFPPPLALAVGKELLKALGFHRAATNSKNDPI